MSLPIVFRAEAGMILQSGDNESDSSRQSDSLTR